MNRSVCNLLSQSVRVPECLVARDHPVTSKPPDRIRDRESADVPATVVGAPARAHSPGVSILTTEVEDEPLCALAVFCEEGAELGDARSGLVAELGEDGRVERVLFKLSYDELDCVCCGNFETIELGLEILVRPLHPCLLEIFLRGLDRRLGWDRECAEEGEDRVEHDSALSADEAEEVVPTTHAVDASFRLFVGIIPLPEVLGAKERNALWTSVFLHTSTGKIDCQGFIRPY